jgi:hypothetical protein
LLFDSRLEEVARMPRVFISYSHDSAIHRARVRDLAQKLRLDGIDCSIDQFVNGQPEFGWLVWMERELEAADFVLLVCTEDYERRFRQEAGRGEGLGVTYESILTREYIYAAQGKNQKFIPVLFPDAAHANIPTILNGRTTYYHLMD